MARFRLDGRGTPAALFQCGRPDAVSVPPVPGVRSDALTDHSTGHVRLLGIKQLIPFTERETPQAGCNTSRLPDPIVTLTVRVSNSTAVTVGATPSV